MRTPTKKILKVIRSLIFLILITSFLCFGYRYYLESSYPIKYKEYVEPKAEFYGVDASLIYAIIRTESKFNETARSRAGAIGLMQVLPSTFEWIKSKAPGTTFEKELESPDVNIDCGVHLISILIDKYENIDFAICAYNAGMGTVDKWLKNPEIFNGKELTNIPYPETATYVRRVKESQEMYKRLYFNKT